MTTKMKTITLHYLGLDRDGVRKTYSVHRVTDSVEFHPRQTLTEAQVKELCGAKDWRVVVEAPKG